MLAAARVLETNFDAMEMVSRLDRRIKNRSEERVDEKI